MHFHLSRKVVPCPRRAEAFYQGLGGEVLVGSDAASEASTAYFLVAGGVRASLIVKVASQCYLTGCFGT
jgi:hypothetical protein